VTAPSAGATVSGSAVMLSASASGGSGIGGVQFTVDSNNLGSEITVAPYTMNWNTTVVPNGAHKIVAGGRDASGNRSASGGTTVTVSNAAPLAVSITSPAPGVSVSGSVTITASASRPSGIEGVQFKVDGSNLGSEVTSAPYTTVWNTAAA